MTENEWKVLKAEAESMDPRRYEALCRDWAFLRHELPCRFGARKGSGGYQAHLAAKEAPCAACSAKRRLAMSVASRRTAACGTNSGFVAHSARGEKVCEPCRLAHVEYQRNYRRRKAA